MDTQLLLKISSNLPDSETEIRWFINEYGGNDIYPWEPETRKLFIDFQIICPQTECDEFRRAILATTILCRKYELFQGDVPETYRLAIHEFGALDKVEDLKKLYIDNILRLVNIYYNANQKSELDNLDNELKKEVKEWNWHPWVKQEEIMAQLSSVLQSVSDIVSVPERNLPQIIHDYYKRIDERRLQNLDSFLQKSEQILKKSSDLKSQNQYFINIVEAIKNGGKSINNATDINPLLGGLKFS